MSDGMLHEEDVRRLRTTLDLVVRTAGDDSFARAAFEAGATAVPAFDHVAVLVFPDEVGDVVEFLTQEQVDLEPPIPSVVVRSRLARRYGLSEEDLEVTILHGRVPGPRSAGIEVFVLPKRLADGIDPGLKVRERATEAEAHAAWFADRDGLSDVWRFCREQLGLTPDGGGFNPYEDAAEVAGRYCTSAGRRVRRRRVVPGGGRSSRLGTLPTCWRPTALPRPSRVASTPGCSPCWRAIGLRGPCTRWWRSA